MIFKYLVADPISYEAYTASFESDIKTVDKIEFVYVIASMDGS